MTRIAAMLLVLVGAALGDEIVAHVSYRTPDGFYVDVGSDAGLRVGDIGLVRRDGVEVVRAEVIAVSPKSARLEIRRGLPGLPGPGEPVLFEAPARVRTDEETPTPVKADEAEPFVPLLERQKHPLEARTRRNIHSGWVSVSQYLQSASADSFDFWTTRIGSAGRVDRLGGKPWALRWSGNVSVRGGEGFEGTLLEGARIDVFELALSHKTESGTLQLGRFLSRALAGVGYLDGIHLEREQGGGFRLGGMLGLKPSRFDLAPSLDEPTAVLYATWSATKWSGTLGVLASMFEGEFDRAALLIDQRIATNGFRVNINLEIDFDVGAYLVREGVRLTRLDVYASQQVSKAVMLRAGVDHYERLDTAAERQGLVDDGTGIDPALFDPGFWRYWVGGRAALPSGFSFDAEVGAVDAPNTGVTPRWRATLARSKRSSRVQLTIFNMEGEQVSGYGARLDGFFTLAHGKWSLQPTVGLRAFDSDVMGGSLSVTDIRLRIEYRPSGKWSFHAGVGVLLGDPIDTYSLELGLRIRW